MPNDEFDRMSLDALIARLSSLPKSNLNSPEYMALLAAIDKKSKEKDTDLQQKHKETITVARQANKISIWAISISVLSLIVAAIALYSK